MDLGLAGKKALVTGGTRGIGRSIAEELANEDCHVGICARDESTVQTAVTALASKGITVTGSAVDVGDGQVLKAWVEAVANDLDGLDLVVDGGFSVAGIQWKEDQLRS